MFECLLCFQQCVHALLEAGKFNGDGDTRVNNLIQSSLQQLGFDADDRAVYESMLLDVATVLYGRNPKAAVCAWSVTDEFAEVKLQQLIDGSLIKIVYDEGPYERYFAMFEQLWVHDVIKCIATTKAHSENMQSMKRVWLPDQVNV
jgi:hypothetical protein